MFPNDLKIADHLKKIWFGTTALPIPARQNGEANAEEVPMRQEIALSRRFMLSSAHFGASARGRTVYGAG
jgi:hypothetical protein